jgi:hypothetical protein
VKGAAFLSVSTQLSTRAINLGLSIAFVRLASPDCIGYFTLLIAAAQMVCSLGRMGTNYSYSILLPRQEIGTKKKRLTSTYVFFGLSTSLAVAGLATWQVIHASQLPHSLQNHLALASSLTLFYLLSDSFSEIIWSIHLARGKFKAVFLRDVWLAFGKGVFALGGALWMGAIGIAAGLGLTGLINSWIAMTLLKWDQQEHQPVTAVKHLLSHQLLGQLLRKGLPFFSVPLVSNLILWPLLINVASSEGLAKLEGLRVAQICAQVIGVISSSLIPVLLVKSSQQGKAGQRIHQRAFQFCWLISMLIYCLYALSDSTLLPLIFGQGATAGVLSIARLFVAAAALQGLSQIPMQRPLTTRALMQLSILQIGSLAIAAMIAIYILNPGDSLMSYASINLISPLITIVFLPKVLGQSLVPERESVQSQVILSALLIGTCFAPPNSAFSVAILALSAIAILAKYLRLWPELAAQR